MQKGATEKEGEVKRCRRTWAKHTPSIRRQTAKRWLSDLLNCAIGGSSCYLFGDRDHLLFEHKAGAKALWPALRHHPATHKPLVGREVTWAHHSPCMCTDKLFPPYTITNALGNSGSLSVTSARHWSHHVSLWPSLKSGSLAAKVRDHESFPPSASPVFLDPSTLALLFCW